MALQADPMLKFVPIPIKRLAQRFIESRGFVRATPSADLHAVMSRRHELSVETVIDVGASDGHWSARMMRYFPIAKYLLIEAQKAAHGAALQRFKADHPNVEYELCAAGDHDGEIYFDASDPMGGQASSTPFAKNNISVPVSTVDNLVRRRNLRGPFLLKLDTHGYEVPILEGARQSMAHSAMLIIEAYNFMLCPGALRFYELCQFLEPRGFRCVDMFDLMNRPGDSAFWQMDMVFLPSTHTVFQSNRYDRE
jgi:FkbM family methyltransferase